MMVKGYTVITMRHYNLTLEICYHKGALQCHNLACHPIMEHCNIRRYDLISQWNIVMVQRTLSCKKGALWCQNGILIYQNESLWCYNGAVWYHKYICGVILEQCDAKMVHCDVTIQCNIVMLKLKTREHRDATMNFWDDTKEYPEVTRITFTLSSHN